MIVTLTAVIGSVVFSAPSGYALSKLGIPKSKTIMSVLLALNFIPNVAVFIPLYLQRFHLELISLKEVKIFQKVN